MQGDARGGAAGKCQAHFFQDSEEAQAMSSEMFTRLDTDSSGFLEAKELRKAREIMLGESSAKYTGAVFGQEWCELLWDMLREIDQNHDGRVAREEWDDFTQSCFEVLGQRRFLEVAAAWISTMPPAPHMNDDRVKSNENWPHSDLIGGPKLSVHGNWSKNAEQHSTGRQSVGVAPDSLPHLRDRQGQRKSDVQGHRLAAKGAIAPMQVTVASAAAAAQQRAQQRHGSQASDAHADRVARRLNNSSQHPPAPRDDMQSRPNTSRCQSEADSHEGKLGGGSRVQRLAPQASQRRPSSQQTTLAAEARRLSFGSPASYHSEGAPVQVEYQTLGKELAVKGGHAARRASMGNAQPRGNSRVTQRPSASEKLADKLARRGSAMATPVPSNGMEVQLEMPPANDFAVQAQEPATASRPARGVSGTVRHFQADVPEVPSPQLPTAPRTEGEGSPVSPKTRQLRERAKQTGPSRAPKSPEDIIAEAEAAQPLEELPSTQTTSSKVRTPETALSKGSGSPGSSLGSKPEADDSSSSSSGSSSDEESRQGSFLMVETGFSPTSGEYRRTDKQQNGRNVYAGPNGSVLRFEIKDGEDGNNWGATSWLKEDCWVIEQGGHHRYGVGIAGPVEGLLAATGWEKRMEAEHPVNISQKQEESPQIIRTKSRKKKRARRRSKDEKPCKREKYTDITTWWDALAKEAGCGRIDLIDIVDIYKTFRETVWCNKLATQVSHDAFPQGGWDAEDLSLHEFWLLCRRLIQLSDLETANETWLYSTVQQARSEPEMELREMQQISIQNDETLLLKHCKKVVECLSTLMRLDEKYVVSGFVFAAHDRFELPESLYVELMESVVNKTVAKLPDGRVHDSYFTSTDMSKFAHNGGIVDARGKTGLPFMYISEVFTHTVRHMPELLRKRRQSKHMKQPAQEKHNDLNTTKRRPSLGGHGEHPVSRPGSSMSNGPSRMSSKRVSKVEKEPQLVDCAAGNAVIRGVLEFTILMEALYKALPKGPELHSPLQLCVLMLYRSANPDWKEQAKLGASH